MYLSSNITMSLITMLSDFSFWFSKTMKYIGKGTKDGFYFWFNRFNFSKEVGPDEKEFSNGIIYHDGEKLRDPLHFR